MIKKLSILFFLCTNVSIISSEYLLVPMDDHQRNHLRSYGLVYKVISSGQKASVLLNYRGGAFLIPKNKIFIRMANIMGVSWSLFTLREEKKIKKIIETQNINRLELEKAPKIAIYKPPTSEPWDDAVTTALDYSQIPYKQLWDKEVLSGELSNYDWLHLHHEDFTGQYGKFFAFAEKRQWYQKRRLEFEKMALSLGISKVTKLKTKVAKKIQSYVVSGGFLFAMCSATDSIDIALSAQDIDIVDEKLDGTPVTPDFNKKLNFDHTFAFQNFEVYPDPYVYEFSDIDVNVEKENIIQDQDFFSLFEFNVHTDPIPALLTQNHRRRIKGFLGQTTAFHLDKIKPRVLILGETLGTNRVKYIYGSYKKGFFSFYAGHDPEDYKHLVGDPPVNLALRKNSPGYRLILNNIFLPAVKKKKRKT